jgi:hypothetical protein
MHILVSGSLCKVADFCHWIGREKIVPIIAILLDVGKYKYKSTVKIKEMALPQ